MTEPQSSDQEWTNRGETSEIWQRYRCPVCGHMDAVSASTPTIASIRCSHCDTALDVDLSSRDRARVSAQVSRKHPGKPT